MSDSGSRTRVQVTEAATFLRPRFEIWWWFEHRDGTRAVPSRPAEFTAYQPGQEPADTSPLLAVDGRAAQELIDQLWRLGVRPTDYHDTRDEVAAQARHLDEQGRVLDRLLAVVEKGKQ